MHHTETLNYIILILTKTLVQKTSDIIIGYVYNHRQSLHFKG